MREQDREAARAGAQIERRGDLLGSADVRRESLRQELGDQRARNDDALVDIEAEGAEPGLVREVRRRHPLVDASREQLSDVRSLRHRQAGVEKRLEPVERQR
jgi:hypothetical protein